jgi:Bacterial SH3 domain
MKYQNKRFQNIGILIVVCAFVALGFVGNATSAQTKKGKSTPTPKSKKATPAPKKNAKATPTPKSKTKSNQKTTAKTKPTPTPKKNAKITAKTTSKKDTKTNSKTASKTDKNSKSKTTRDTKSSSKKPTVASKTANKPVNRNTKTTMPVKPKTTTTSRTTRPKTTTTTPIKINTNLPEIVVSSFSTTVRSAPSSSASEVTRAKLGSVYKVVDKSSGWYKVEYSNQKTGWIPTTAAVDSDKNGNDEIYRQVLAKNSGSGKMSFAESVEIYEFLTRVQPEIKDANTAAEFGLRRLIALRSALGAIPSGQSNQKIYQDFLKAQDENIVYSDPSGEWYVRAPLFWELHSKYTSTPSGERIAWEAAKNPLPGECEGYVNCYIFLLRMTDGEYLNFYPTGAHSAEALRNITTFLEPIADDADAKKVYNGPTDVSDRAEFNSLITELRVIISRLPNTEKEKALQQLKKIAEGFK